MEVNSSWILRRHARRKSCETSRLVYRQILKFARLKQIVPEFFCDFFEFLDTKAGLVPWYRPSKSISISISLSAVSQLTGHSTYLFIYVYVYLEYKRIVWEVQRWENGILNCVGMFKYRHSYEKAQIVMKLYSCPQISDISFYIDTKFSSEK
jgi:hypothetical protein